MSKTALFAGTTEGRLFLEEAGERGDVTVFVATAYGRACLEKACAPRTEIRQGRLDAEEMTAVFKEEHFDFVVDATHPHAEIVTENIRKACAETGITYLRIIRKEEHVLDADVLYFPNLEAICQYLAQHEGKALLTTGSKSLLPYTKVPGYAERFYLRVLSGASAVKKAEEAGFKGKHLIAMQGPFSVEMNALLLKETGAEYFVTKDSGAAGGFPEKIAAVKRAGAKLLVVSRKAESGVTYQEAARKVFGAMTKVALIGIGTGNPRDMTLRAKEAAEKADILIGARRMLDGVCTGGKETFALYRPKEILDVIHAHAGRRIAVLYSGDTGFHSGAEKLLYMLKGEEGIQTDVINGLSTVSTFAARLGRSYDAAALLSLHGEKTSVLEALLEKGKVFVLMDYRDTISKVLQALTEAGLEETFFAAGSRLGYPEECIITGVAGDGVCLPEKFADLSILYLEKTVPSRIVSPGLPDEMFQRGQVPMTKREIRSVILSALELKSTDIFYDIGAGTGSVSCEAARLLKAGSVLAAERTQEGVALIKENRRQMHLENLFVYHGEAPEILEKMTERALPTVAFIGGSGGKLQAIFDGLRDINPEIRIVLSAITPETLGEAALYAKTHHLEMESTLIQSARSRKAGPWHLMTGMNPVWIVNMKGDNNDEI